MKVSELKTVLGGYADTLDKALAEIKAAVSDPDVPADVQAALDRVSAVSKALDDLNPDGPPPPPPTT